MSIKYFAMGFAFYFFTSLLFRTMSLSRAFMAFFVGIQVSVVIIIGLFKGPTQGLAFGSSNFFVDVVFLFLYGYIYPASLLSSLIVAITHMIYGYLPATLYRKRSTISFGFIGFFIALLINLFLFLPIYGLERYLILWLSNYLLWVFIIGTLSVVVSFIKLKSKTELPIERQVVSRSEINLLVDEAKQRDVGKGIARINQKAMQVLGVRAGDVIEIEGDGITTATVWPAYTEDQDKDIIRLDEITRKNAGVTINSNTVVRKARINKALSIILAPTEMRLNVDEDFTQFVKNRLIDKSMVEGNTVLVMMLGHAIPFKVVSTDPKGVVKVATDTELEIFEFFEESKREGITSQTIPQVTERQENLMSAPAEFSEEREIIKEETHIEKESRQLYGTLVLPDQSELPIGLKRVIGREDLAKYVSPEKAWWISKQHLLIFQEGGSFYIEDNSSTNGTKLNGIEIRNMGKQKLNDNDEIIVADLVKILFKSKINPE